MCPLAWRPIQAKGGLENAAGKALLNPKTNKEVLDVIYIEGLPIWAMCLCHEVEEACVAIFTMLPFDLSSKLFEELLICFLFLLIHLSPPFRCMIPYVIRIKTT